MTPSSRRLVMTALLALALSGGVIRYFAANPSVLRDVGTLLLVLWLPAVGNLIGWLARKIPRQAPPPTQFAPGGAFQPHLRVSVEPISLPPGWLATLDPTEVRCTVLTGRRGFTVRTAQPLAQVLSLGDTQEIVLEALLPKVALQQLPPHTAFHLLAGTTAVAKGRVLAAAK